jgi:hypothetical protein
VIFNPLNAWVTLLLSLAIFRSMRYCSSIASSDTGTAAALRQGPIMEFVNVNELDREALNDWYERNVGYRPDDDNGAELPLDELRETVDDILSEAHSDLLAHGFTVAYDIASGALCGVVKDGQDIQAAISAREAFEGAAFDRSTMQIEEGLTLANMARPGDALVFVCSEKTGYLMTDDGTEFAFALRRA